MEPITVKTPGGIGRVWGIAKGEVIVEMDYSYLVAFTPEDVEFLERRRCKWVNLKRRRNSIIRGGVNGGRNDAGDGHQQTK